MYTFITTPLQLLLPIHVCPNSRPHLLIISTLCRQKSGIWGFRSDRTEVIEGHDSKVYTLLSLFIIKACANTSLIIFNILNFWSCFWKSTKAIVHSFVKNGVLAWEMNHISKFTFYFIINC